jgi:hypothetical protein
MQLTPEASNLASSRLLCSCFSQYPSRYNDMAWRKHGETHCTKCSKGVPYLFFNVLKELKRTEWTHGGTKLVQKFRDLYHDALCLSAKKRCL